MFAPHCPTCRGRVLLGPGRIVSFSADGGRRGAILRCFCGHLLDWDQAPAADQAEPSSSPADAGAGVGEQHPVEECVPTG